MRPLSNSGWRTVVRPAYAEISMSSKPTTRQVVGNAQARGARRGEHAGRLHVRRREHRGGPVALRQQLFGEPLRDGAVVRSVAHELGAGREAGGAEHLAVAALARGTRGEAERVVGVVADERDALVTEREEVAGRDPPALDVIGDDHVDVLTPCVDEYDRNPGIREPFELAAGRWHREHEQTVGPIAARQRGEVLVPVHRRLDVEEHEVVPAPVERGDDAA